MGGERPDVQLFIDFIYPTYGGSHRKTSGERDPAGMKVDSDISVLLYF